MISTDTPHDSALEEAVVGGMLLHRQARAYALDLLRAEDFYVPELAGLVATIEAFELEERPFERVLLAAGAGVTVGRLLELEAQAPVSGSVRTLAEGVLELASLRRAISLGDDLRTAGYERNVDKVDELLADPMDRVIGQYDPTLDPVEARELVNVAPAPEFLIDPLLARGEMVLWVGEPGYGKSTLMRQFSVLLASGLHPFTRTPLPASLRVLMYDCQETDGKAGSELEPLLRRAGSAYSGSLFVRTLPAGMDLTATRWQRLVDSHCAKLHPDLVVIGPLYNAVRGARGRSKQSEETAELALEFLVRLMVRRSCALMIEAHAPHGDDMRVRGSKLWEDQPDFSFGLVQDAGYEHGRAVDVVKNRGDRRSGAGWPKRYVQGAPGQFPWEATGVARARQETMTV